MNKQKEYNKKTILIEVSSYCINKCDGCMYSQNERDDKTEMSVEDFTSVIEYFNNFTQKNNLVPHFFLGNGEVLGLKKLNTYVDIIIEKTKNNKNFDKDGNHCVIELATTGRIENYEEVLDSIVEKINNHKILLLIEFVLNGLNNTDYPLIEKNIKYTQSKNIITPTVFKSSTNYVNNINILIENILSIEFVEKKVFDVDYIQLFGKKSLTLENFTLMYEQVKAAIKNNTWYLDAAYEFRDNETNVHNYGYYVNINLELNFLMENVFGDLIMDSKTLPQENFINLKERSYEEFEQYLLLYITKNMEKNNIKRKQYQHCAKCTFNKLCPIYFVEQASKVYNLEFSEKMCLAGAHILNKYHNELLI